MLAAPLHGPSYMVQYGPPSNRPALPQPKCPKCRTSFARNQPFAVVSKHLTDCNGQFFNGTASTTDLINLFKVTWDACMAPPIQAFHPNPAMQAHRPMSALTTIHPSMPPPPPPGLSVADRFVPTRDVATGAVVSTGPVISTSSMGNPVPIPIAILANAASSVVPALAESHPQQMRQQMPLLPPRPLAHPYHPMGSPHMQPAMLPYGYPFMYPYPMQYMQPDVSTLATLLQDPTRLASTLQQLGQALNVRIKVEPNPESDFQPAGSHDRSGSEDEQSQPAAPPSVKEPKKRSAGKRDPHRQPGASPAAKRVRLAGGNGVASAAASTTKSKTPAGNRKKAVGDQSAATAKQARSKPLARSRSQFTSEPVSPMDGFEHIEDEHRAKSSKSKRAKTTSGKRVPGDADRRLSSANKTVAKVRAGKRNAVTTSSQVTEDWGRSSLRDKSSSTVHASGLGRRASSASADRRSDALAVSRIMPLFAMSPSEETESDSFESDSEESSAEADASMGLMSLAQAAVATAVDVMKAKSPKVDVPARTDTDIPQLEAAHG